MFRFARESNSSKNMTDGAAALAFSKISRMLASVSPTYLDNNSGPLTPMKLNRDSDAKACAINVLLHPGGPYINTPRCGREPAF